MRSNQSPQSRETISQGSVTPLVLSALTLCIACYFGFRWWQIESRGWTPVDSIGVLDSGPPLRDFEVTEREGVPLRSQELRGKVWVASFFFTGCPGACAQLNQRIKDLHNDGALQDVTWVSITCDPENDKVGEALLTNPMRTTACQR
ncbi:hypothetical protein Pla175_29750 [Pirellulimonas nuda]|uniref:SCO1/SenC n=1 Tax=Pirellulimonas nuda TaxID=2528009 RepID=A0A518DDN6_9BACT|nr:hypothetical protein Pla175_29750 [Pirellulimonas nuda]